MNESYVYRSKHINTEKFIPTDMAKFSTFIIISVSSFIFHPASFIPSDPPILLFSSLSVELQYNVIISSTVRSSPWVATVLNVVEGLVAMGKYKEIKQGHKYISMFESEVKPHIFEP